MAKPEVKVGQVYRDKDKRMLSGRRYLIVREVGSPKSKLAPCSVDGTAYNYRYDNVEPLVTISNKNLQSRFELVSGREEVG